MCLRVPCAMGSRNAHHGSWPGQSAYLVYSRRTSGDCGLSGERWTTPPYPQPSLAPAQLPPPPAPPGWALGASQPETSSSSQGATNGLFHLPCSFLLEIYGLVFASLLLYVMIKYCLSAQLIPKAKGKSLCPHIICKLPLSPRTDLFTGREFVLYYPDVNSA